MNPEAIQTSFLDRNDPEAQSSPHFSLSLEFCEVSEQTRNVAPGHDVSRHSLARTWRKRGHKPF